MLLSENPKASGSLVIELFDQNGNLKDRREIKNLIVNTGLAFMAQRLISTPTALSHMGIGTSSSAPAGAQTDLLASTARVALTSSTNITTTVTNDTARFIATFGASVGTGAIQEAGLFNASTAGTMLCRTVFAVVNKGALDSMTITWDVKFA